MRMGPNGPMGRMDRYGRRVDQYGRRVRGPRGPMGPMGGPMPGGPMNVPNQHKEPNTQPSPSKSNDKDVIIYNNQEYREVRNDYVFFEKMEKPDPSYEKEYYIHQQIERTIDESDVIIFKTEQNENSVELERFM